MTAGTQIGADMELCKKLDLLLRNQLLIRCVVSRDELTGHNEGYRAELVCARSSFDVNGDNYSGFMHLGWTFDFHSREEASFETIFDVIQREDGKEEFIQELFLAFTVKVTDFWKRNMTGDGLRPYEEWCVPKPFVGVLNTGRKDGVLGVITEIAHPDSRPMMMYHASLFFRLQSYVDKLYVLANHYDPGLAPRLEFFKCILERFETFLIQIQRTQLPRVLK